MGLADAFNWSSQGMTVFGKFISSFLVLYFWDKLDIVKFMFGTDHEWLDKFTLAAFYILVIDTFVQFFQSSYLNLAVKPVAKIFVGFNMVTLKNFFASTYLWLNTPSAGPIISTVSIYIGSFMLMLIAIYITFKVKINEKSIIHSLISLFDRKNRFWRKIKEKYSLLRLLIVIIVLFGVWHFFFQLVTQWFVIAVDNALLIMSVIWLLSHFKGSKNRVLDYFSNMADMILSKIIALFTNPRKFPMGISFLLIFYYLSDMGTYFVNYILMMPKEPYYFCKLGDICFKGDVISTQLHKNILQLFRSETITTMLDKISLIWTYILSDIGLAVIILVPTVISFFIVFNVALKRVASKKVYILPLVLFFISASVFVMAPWVSQKAIIPSAIEYSEAVGVYGVDFITHKISTIALFPVIGIFIISVALILLSLFDLKVKLSEHITVILSLGSLIFMGNYIVNFLWSTINYFFNSDYGALTIFLGQNDFFIVFVLGLIFLLDLVFYIGVFILFTYHISTYIINHIIRKLITTPTILLWTFILLFVPAFIMRNFNLWAIVHATIVIVIFFIFTYVLYKKIKGKEHRDDYLLSVNIAIAGYQLLLILAVLISKQFGYNLGVYNFIQPFIVFMIALFSAKLFRFKIMLNAIRPTKSTVAILAGLTFGMWFYFVNEPQVMLFNTGVIVFVLFTIMTAVAEEFMFRGVLYKLARKGFNHLPALVIQALVFAFIHFMGFGYIYSHYLINGSLLFTTAFSNSLAYLVSLFVFGLVAGALVGERRGVWKGSIIYAIAMHAFANIVRFLL